jgi:hypothetical protein
MGFSGSQLDRASLAQRERRGHASIVITPSCG